MKKSLFSTATLLCAVSFNALQASHDNPYEISQERTRQNRCIRVITEIPVEMAGFMMPRHSCEQAGLPSASEPKKADTKALVESLLDSSVKKSKKDEPFMESVLQMLIALTKNLKVVPPADDTTSTPNNMEYLPDPDFDGTEETFGIGVAEAIKAREAEAKAKAAATEAEEVAKKAKASEKATKEIEAREAAANAIRLRGLADEAAKVVNARGADVKALDDASAGKPPLVYKEPTRSGAARTAATMMDKKYASDRMTYSSRMKALDAAAKDTFDTSKARDPLTTNVELADELLKQLRGTGAQPVVPGGAILDIKSYLESNPAGITPGVRAIALAALPAPVV